MTDRHARAVARLEARLRSAPAELAPEARAAAIDVGPLPDPVAQRYVETVRQHAYQMTDRRLEELADAGWTDGQVFELTSPRRSGRPSGGWMPGLRRLARPMGLRGSAGAG